MALDHFNLSRPPFSALPDPAFHYEDAARRELLGALQYALRLGDGVIKVTGEPGSGKTMLCRVLAEKLAQAAPPVQALLLERPVNTAGIALSPQDAVCAIARQLGLDPAGLRSDEIMRLLHSHLAAERAAGKLAVLLVEESQALPADTLETLRQLTNLSEGPHNLLPVVLLGTPELSNVLRQPKLRQLRERITLSFVLPALPPELAPELLACRLRAAGHADGALFQLDAAKLIARTAGADLRAVMALAARSLAVAAEASAPAVAMLHVRDAIKGSSGHSVFDAAPEALSTVISVAPLPQVTAIGQDGAVPEAAPDAGVMPLPAPEPEATPVPEPTAASTPKRLKYRRSPRRRSTPRKRQGRQPK
jgi:type II secretory pathway predicted ATPase ExeA